MILDLLLNRQLLHLDGGDCGCRWRGWQQVLPGSLGGRLALETRIACVHGLLDRLSRRLARAHNCVAHCTRGSAILTIIRILLYLLLWLS